MFPHFQHIIEFDIHESTWVEEEPLRAAKTFRRHPLMRLLHLSTVQFSVGAFKIILHTFKIKQRAEMFLLLKL